MSRIGKKPVVLPKGVTITKTDTALSVKGPKGELTMQVHPSISISIEGNEVAVMRGQNSKTERELHGTTRALLQNMVTGVSEGFTRKLEMVGVGYRAEKKGAKIQLALGYSHPIIFFPPASVTIEVPQPTAITITGIDKQLVGQIAAKIRSFRKPEPYKGKGVRYEGERVRRKAGKAAGKAKK